LVQAIPVSVPTIKRGIPLMTEVRLGNVTPTIIDRLGVDQRLHVALSELEVPVWFLRQEHRMSDA
jgi:hypothetical protein